MNASGTCQTPGCTNPTKGLHCREHLAQMLLTARTAGRELRRARREARRS